MIPQIRRTVIPRGTPPGVGRRACGMREEHPGERALQPAPARPRGARGLPSRDPGHPHLLPPGDDRRDLPGRCGGQHRARGRGACCARPRPRPGRPPPRVQPHVRRGHGRSADLEEGEGRGRRGHRPPREDPRHAGREDHRAARQLRHGGRQAAADLLERLELPADPGRERRRHPDRAHHHGAAIGLPRHLREAAGRPRVPLPVQRQCRPPARLPGSGHGGADPGAGRLAGGRPAPHHRRRRAHRPRA